MQNHTALELITQAVLVNLFYSVGVTEVGSNLNTLCTL
jgi:hypothetical protein